MLKYLISFIFITSLSCLGKGIASPLLEQMKSADNTKNVSVNYNLYAGGIKGVAVNINILWSNNHYQLTTTTKTEGVIGFLYPVVATYFTKGIVKDNQAYPEKYVATSISRGSEKVKELKYDKQGRVIERVNIKKGKEISREVDDDMGKGSSLDYQSVLAMMLKRIDDGLDCNQTYTAFDGKRRYTMIFEDLGIDSLEKTRYSDFEGKAKECSLLVEPFNGDYPDNSWFWYRSGKDTKQKPMKFWTAKISGLTVPVRIEIDSLGFGTIIAHMQKS
ncbi:MAG: DUF3108 domain-containing protein [Alphaproteobacteria bacterium]